MKLSPFDLRGDNKRAFRRYARRVGRQEFHRLLVELGLA